MKTKESLHAEKEIICSNDFFVSENNPEKNRKKEFRDDKGLTLTKNKKNDTLKKIGI